MKNLRQSVSGFTLIELMVVVSVIGVLAAFALSSFTSLTQSTQAKNASFELFTNLLLARSEAIKSNGNVTLTPVNAANWGQGWTITTAAGATIKNQAALKGATTVGNKAPTLTITLGPASVVYARTGRTAAAAFQIDVTPVNANVRRCIVIGLSGMPYTKPMPVATCP